MSNPSQSVNLQVPADISEANHRMLSQQLAHWAVCQPDKPAIVTPQGAFTYAQLNHAVNRVAAAVLRVRQQAGGGQMRVPLLFMDPFKQVAAFIGVEKAGVCHVSLNSGSPEVFLSQISENLEPGLILTEAILEEKARKLAPFDMPKLIFENLPDAGPEDAVCGSYTLDDLHCILFTSGSSGRPKGVMHSRYLEAFQVAYAMSLGSSRHADRVLLAAARHSGLGCGIARNTLAVGATAYLPNMSGEWVTIARRWLESEQITTVITMPSMMRALFEGIEAKQPYECLKRISISGEVALASDFETFKRHCLPGALFNIAFGSSEGGMYTMAALTHDSVVTTPGIPLGNVMGFVEIAIVDEQMTHLPAGQAGEFVVRTPALAAGYWKMPELTAQRFLPDPDGGRRRIYRTGDAGMISPDGTITFLGRVDDEVKINGNRVSIPLIEDALRGCPGVQNVTVQSKARSTNGSPCLAAYYVALPDVALGGSTLRDYLKDRLPGHMIPAYFVRLEAIPLNANGKVDRFALPKADEFQRPPGQSYVAPRSDTERQIAAVWSSILGVKDIGVDDRFLDLGGDSLQAVRMLIQVNEALGTTLDIPALNEARTVAELAALIGARADTSRYPPVMLLKKGTGTPLFLFHAVGGNVLVYQALADRLTGDRPIYGILAQGLNSDEKPLMSVPEIARRHIRLMKALQPKGPYHFGGYSFGGFVAYEVAQQLREAGEQIGLVLALDIRVRLPKTLTTGQKIRKRITREARRITHHLGYFATHSPSAWVPYVQELMTRIRRGQRNAVLLRQHDAAYQGQIDRYLEEVDEVASPAILAAIDAHNLAGMSYRAKPYVGDVVVVLAHETNFEGLEAWKAPWLESVQGTVEFIEVPGDHRNMMQEPQVNVMAERLNPILTAAFANPSAGTTPDAIRQPPHPANVVAERPIDA